MPKITRNFFVEATVDGKKTVDAYGPKSKGGGFTQLIRVREKGRISDKQFYIEGVLESPEVLAITIIRWSKEGQRVIYSERFQR